MREWLKPFVLSLFMAVVLSLAYLAFDAALSSAAEAPKLEQPKSAPAQLESPQPDTWDAGGAGDADVKHPLIHYRCGFLDLLWWTRR